MSIGILIQWFFPPQNCSGTKNKQTNKNRGLGGGRESYIQEYYIEHPLALQQVP